MAVFSINGLRQAVSIYHFLLALGGLTLAILSLTLLVNSPVIALSPASFLISGLVGGMIIMLIAFVTAWGIKSNHRILIIVTALLSLALTSLGIVAVIQVEGARQQDSIQAQLDRLWDDAPTPIIVQIQTWGQCCGFTSYIDRFQEPCTLYADEVGCLEPMRRVREGKLRALAGPAAVMVVGQAVGLILVIIIAWAGWREERRAQLVGERQPFDAWHKAVFQ